VELTIELGHLPDPDLNPNKTLHHLRKWKSKMIAKQEINVLCLASKQIPAHPLTKATVTITFIASDKKRRDLDNLFASMKSYIDGLVLAKVLVDDNTGNIADYNIRYRIAKQGESANTIIKIVGY